MVPEVFSINRLREIIDSSDFDSLKGEVENDWFECKGQPYQLDNDSGKRELAKDVSSFANHNGGYILIGVKTKSSLTYLGDAVEEIRPFEQTLVDVGRYYNVIRDWIYPAIEGITIRWIQVKGNQDKGVIVIDVPQQKVSFRPFLIKKVLDEKKQVEIVFGYAERKRDNSQPLSVVDLQRALRSGFNFESSINERLDTLEALVKQSVNHLVRHSSKEDLNEVINKRIEDTLGDGKIKQRRALIISIYPSQPTELETIFQTSENSIRRHLENPPTLRYGGWSLVTYEQARIIRGELIRIGDSDYKVIDLYRDGTMILAVAADSQFLAWGRPESHDKINPIALVEVVYNFASLYKLVLADFKEAPEKISVRVDLRNMHISGVKSFLVPYGINSWAYSLGVEKKEAPDNDGIRVIELTTKDFDAGEAAFKILKEIYLWFGLEEDKIPYTKTENGKEKVDPDQIKGLGNE